MLTRRLCAFRGPTGEPCQSPPLHDSRFCFMHAPEHAQEAQEARRLGGLRRKREATVLVAYDFEGLETLAGIRRLIQVAVIDTLSLDNSVARNRTLTYLAMAALRTLEVGDLQERINALEQAVRSKQIEREPPIFDVEPEVLEPPDKEAT